MKKTIKVGIYKKEYNEALGIDLQILPIVYVKGLKEHLIRRKHFDVIEYVDDLETILDAPDYVSASQTDDKAILLVKQLSHNVTVIVKLDSDGDNYYVATMYSMTDRYLDRKIHSGQYKPLTKNE